MGARGVSLDWSPVPEAAGVPWRGCRVLPIPAGVQSCGRGQPGPGVAVHVLASGLQIFLMGLRSSALVWAARWDGLGSQEPVELRVPPCTGLWPPQTEHSGRRRVGGLRSGAGCGKRLRTSLPTAGSSGW